MTAKTVKQDLRLQHKLRVANDQCSYFFDYTCGWKCQDFCHLLSVHNLKSSFLHDLKRVFPVAFFAVLAFFFSGLVSLNDKTELNGTLSRMENTVLPVWHLFPINPGGHTQTCLFAVWLYAQSPWWHGEGRPQSDGLAEHNKREERKNQFSQKDLCLHTGWKATLHWRKNEKRSAWTCWRSGWSLATESLPVDGDRMTALIHYERQRWKKINFLAKKPLLHVQTLCMLSFIDLHTHATAGHVTLFAWTWSRRTSDRSRWHDRATRRSTY